MDYTSGAFFIISASWHKIRGKAGLPHLRCHDLRHGAASNLINSGARSLYIVQQILAHSTPMVTQHFTLTCRCSPCMMLLRTSQQSSTGQDCRWQRWQLRRRPRQVSETGIRVGCKLLHLSLPVSHTQAIPGRCTPTPMPQRETRHYVGLTLVRFDRLTIDLVKLLIRLRA